MTDTTGREPALPQEGEFTGREPAIPMCRAEQGDTGAICTLRREHKGWHEGEAYAGWRIKWIHASRISEVLGWER